MSLLLLFLKAFRLVDFGIFDLPLGMILFDLDLLILIRLVWTVRRWN